MRKVTRKSLDELAKVMPVLSEREQRVYVGGTSGATGYTDAGLITIDSGNNLPNDGKAKPWVVQLLTTLYDRGGTGTINLNDIIHVDAVTTGSAYCKASASYQNITINGITFTNLYVEATSSAAHPTVDSGYSWTKPKYDGNNNLVQMNYIFNVHGTNLNVVIGVPVEQVKDFERTFKMSH